MLGLSLDPWQEKVLAAEGNLCLRSGRQVGKSTVISIKAAELAVRKKNQTIMIIAAVERQAFLMFEKTLAYMMMRHPKMIKKGKYKPTKHKLQLTNGSIIYSLPTGMTGYGIRGYTVNYLIADEAHFIPEDVWVAVAPMMAATDGKMILLSTPHGRSGFFARCFDDKNFESFKVSSEDCPRIQESFLEAERARMTAAQYAQEYLGEFIDELRQVFPDALIKKYMTLKRRENKRHGRKYYLGVDIARMGEDESTFEVLDRTNPRRVEHVEHFVTKKTLTVETTQFILALDRTYNFRQIFVDDGGMGVGVFDQLLTTDATKRKVVAINNLSRPLTKDEKRKKKVIKEDIVNNMLAMMERGELFLLDDPEIFLSLKSLQFEVTEGKTKYFGSYTHIADGLVRAAWAVKDKRLNIYKY